MQDYYFRALYVLVEKSEALVSLQAAVSEQVRDLGAENPSTEDYMPHLSLLYDDAFSQLQKDRLIQPLYDDGMLSRGLNGDTLVINGQLSLNAQDIVVVRSEGSVESWRVILTMPLRAK